jgi:WD40 repeat protein
MRNTATVGGRVFKPEALSPFATRLADVAGFIEPMHLQVVCRQLWDAMPGDDLSIDPVDVDKFGDVTGALRAYYDGRVKDNRAIREWFQEKLIKGGIRGQVQMGAEHSEGLPNEVIETLFDTHLVRAEERRRNRWVELAHDRLIEPVQLANKEWFEKNLHETQKRAAFWVKQHRLEALLLTAEELTTHRRWIVENGATLTPTEQQFLVDSEKRRLREQHELGQQTRIRQALSRALRLDARKDFGGDRSVDALAKLAFALRLDPDSIAARVWIAGLLQQQSWWLEVDIARTFTNSVEFPATWNGAYSPDGARFLTPSAERQLVSLWDLETGQRIASSGPTATGDISPDGSRILRKSSEKGAIELCLASLTPCPYALLRQRNANNGAIFSPDGRSVVTICVLRQAQIWDSASGERVGEEFTVHESPVFSPDGSQILAMDSGSITVRDLATGDTVGHPMPLPEDLHSLAFSPDGRLVCVVTKTWDSSPQRVEIWNFLAGKPCEYPLAHLNLGWDPVFTPDASRLATAETEGIVRLYEVDTAAALDPPLTHNASVKSVAFSPDGSRILTSAEDNLCRIWNAATGSPMGTPFPHHGDFRKPVFSPDGTRIVTSPSGGGISEGGNAQLWDAFTGQPLGPPLGAGTGLLNISFSPDGRFVLTGSSWNCTATVWDTATGERCGSPLVHDAMVIAANFACGQRYASTRSFAFINYLIDVSARQPVGNWQLRELPVTWATFSPDGQRIATATVISAQQWDAATGEKLGPPLEHASDVLTVAYSPDGRLLLTASWDQTAQLWDAATGAKAGPPLPHDHGVLSAAFAPDGKSILTVAGKVAQLWNTETCQKSGPPFAHESDIRAASCSPDGQRVVTAAEDGTARVWSVATGYPLGPPLLHPDRVDNAIFSADGERVLTLCRSEIAQLWNPATGEPLGPPMASTFPSLFRAAFSTHEHFLLTATRYGHIEVWDLSAGVIVDFKALGEDGQPVPVSPDGRSLAVASAGDGKFSLLLDSGNGLQPVGQPMPGDAPALSADGRFVFTQTECFGSVQVTARRLANRPTAKIPLLAENYAACAAFSADGRWIAVGSTGGGTTIWDAVTGQQFGTPLVHDGGAQEVSFSPDGQCLATVTGDDFTATLWRVSNGERIAILAQEVLNLAFAPDGKTIWTDGRAGITVWDTQSREALRTRPNSRKPVFSKDGSLVVTLEKNGAQVLDPSTGARVGARMAEIGDIQRAVFSQDGTRVLTCAEKTARIWDSLTGRPVSPAMEQAGEIISIAFSPAGDRVATGSLDGTARIWNAKTATPIGMPLIFGSRVEMVAFSSDGRAVAAREWEGRLHIHDAASGELIEETVTGEAPLAAFSPDGQHILTSNTENQACRYRFLIDSGTPEDTQLLAEFAEAVAGQAASEDGTLTPIDQYAALRRVIEKAETNPGPLGVFIRQYIPE